MDRQTVFRISGAPLTKHKLPTHFRSSAYGEPRIFKLFRERTSDELVEVVATHGSDIVLVKINGGPLLVLHPSHAGDLFGSTGIRAKGRVGDVAVSRVLPWSGARPGRLYGTKVTPADASADWFAVLRCAAPASVHDAAARFLPAGQPSSLLYALAPDQAAATAADPGADGARLVFIHGTFVQSRATFGALWETGDDGRERLPELIQRYGPGRVLAFDYPALTQGPVQNALALALLLPARVTLDLVTHGAGGLVAEVLVRAATQDDRDATLAGLGEADARDLSALREHLRSTGISVRRVVRVACPARGALLAAHRPDAWLSVGLWLARVSGMPCSEQGNQLVAALACDIDAHDPPGLPGLAAMDPERALVRWLNAPSPTAGGDLYVVAGDSEGDNLFGWLQALVSDAMLWTDNDLLVQTRSMFGGAPRATAEGVKMLLLRDDRIMHFTYFQRRQVVDAILAVLVGQATARARADPLDAFLPVADASGAWVPVRLPAPAAPAAVHPAAAPQPDGRKPWLLLVPDLFGSVLVDNHGNRFWLDEAGLGRFRDFGLDATRTIAPEGLVGAYYGELRAHFERTHHVIDFPYDWRLDLETGAVRLAACIDEITAAPRIGEQPLRILAHGMGGLLVRAWHALHADSWERFAARPGTRLLLLGVPNLGSLLPLRLFSGDELFGTVLGGMPSIADERALRDLLAAMPGIVQLQAGVSGAKPGLRQATQWRALEAAEFRAQRRVNRWHGVPDGTGRMHVDGWGIPSNELLTQAADFWGKLERALPNLLSQRDKLVVAGGTGFATVSGIEAADDDLFFLTSRDGDRQVTLDSAGLPGLALWLVAAPHDALCRTSGAFAALSDLIERGTTARLTSVIARHPARGVGQTPLVAARRLPSHGGREFAAAAFFQPDSVAAGADDGLDEALTVRVHHGDLRFVREPLLVGHYRSMVLTGTEAAIDSLVRGRMSQALRTGVYPERVGSFQVFENGRHRNLGRRKQRYIPRPCAAVVVGLGEEGKLTAQQLAYTLRIGVLAYAERFAESGERHESFELAATLTGSGGTGVTVSMATVALLQGVLDANVKLRESGWPFVAALTIVELYLDRAADALRVLNMQAATMTRLRVGKLLHSGDGGLRRPVDTSYRGAGYDFISALKSAESTVANPVIAYALDTRRARTEVRAQQSQGPLVRDLVCKSANTRTWDRQIGRTLFNLLIPVEIEPYLTGSAEMVMELDGTTAALPWEMLDTDPPHAPAQQAHALPWSIRCKVLRKLRTDAYRPQVLDAATEDRILIIGDPLTQGSSYPPLEAARAEASSIAAVARTSLRLQRDHVVELNERPNATTIINALFAHRYRIVHIAGHGSEPDPARSGSNGGVVLSGENTFLGANEIRAMRVTPELVFLNCCHLARIPGQQEYDRVAFAATIARELIDIGVRCVIAAGWAIEDKPAEVFATTFYREIFSGRRFIDAVGAARAASYQAKRESNTWAAYQCYGDPDWSWKAATGSTQLTPEEEYDGIASPTSLILVLQALRSDLIYTAHDTSVRNGARLRYLVRQFAVWSDRGDVAQEFAAAFAALPERRIAIEWYGRATRAKDGSASITAVELQAEQLSLPDADVKELERAIELFGDMNARHGNSLQRLSLAGNAHRRLSMRLLHQEGMPDTEATGAVNDTPRPAPLEGSAAWHLVRARELYLAAARCEPDAFNRFYPLRAVISCRVREELVEGNVRSDSEPAVDMCQAGLRDALERDFAEVLLAIGRALRDNPNFWPIVAQSELEILKGVITRNLAVRRHDIGASLRDLHNRIGTRRFWVYVHDDARTVLDPYSIRMTREGQADEAQAAQALLRALSGYGTGLAAGAGKP